ncbi:MAG: SDR family NAD(P)-dependent oxidoreductase [Acholeplasmatales bacterium]|nr:SDR family NAD(P)-dependent oxidoreductase [Acholeplasmatales bacterium]
MYALITGASSGIGFECAKILASKGYDLIITARSIDKLNNLKELINKEYQKEVVIIPLDISKRESLTELFTKTKDYEIEVVINNAGLGKVGMFNEVTDAEDFNMIDINVTAMHMILKHYADVMNKGYILTVASIASFAPGPKMATYYATKNYIRSYAEALRYEMKKLKKDVGITILAPGPVDTNFNDTANVTFKLKGVKADKCASYAIKRMFKKKKFATPKWSVRAASRLMRIIPHRTSMRICYKSQSKKQK